MKQSILSLLLAIPCCAMAQTRTDYDHAMAKFMTFYNAGQADSIAAQFSEMWDSHKATLWTDERNKEIMNKYGKMISYKYIGRTTEDSVMVYRTVFSKSTHATSLLLDKNKKMDTFRFDTMSDEIAEMMKTAK